MLDPEKTCKTFGLVPVPSTGLIAQGRYSECPVCRALVTAKRAEPDDDGTSRVRIAKHHRRSA